MLHLLKLEWKKVNNYRPFQVTMILFFIGLPALLLIGKQFPDMPTPSGQWTNNVFYEFPTVWGYLGYIGNWLVFFFLGFMAILSITNEFGNKTLRQNIITGMSRKEFYIGKVLFILSISLAVTLYFALVGFLLGLTHSEGFSTENLDYIPRFFIMSFCYMSLGLFLGILIRRTGIAIVIYFAYAMFVERIIRYGIHLNLMDKLGFDINKSMHYYPINATSDLMPVPAPEIAEDMARNADIYPFIEPMEAAVVALVYASIFLYFGYRLMKNRDL